MPSKPSRDIVQQKAALRADMRAGRKALIDSKASFRADAAARVVDHFFLQIDIAAGVAVSAFWPLADEFDTRPLLAALHERGHACLLPTVVARRAPLIFRQWTPQSRLTPGSFGVLEPAADAPEHRPALLLVPLLAFDAHGFRLGYGGGYYDRTLAALRAGEPRATAVGLAFSAQEVDEVPRDASDEPLDCLLSETGLKRFDGSE